MISLTKWESEYGKNAEEVYWDRIITVSVNLLSLFPCLRAAIIIFFTPNGQFFPSSRNLMSILLLVLSFVAIEKCINVQVSVFGT